MCGEGTRYEGVESSGNRTVGVGLAGGGRLKLAVNAIAECVGYGLVGGRERDSEIMQ